MKGHERERERPTIKRDVESRGINLSLKAFNFINMGRLKDSIVIMTKGSQKQEDLLEEKYRIVGFLQPFGLITKILAQSVQSKRVLVVKFENHQNAEKAYRCLWGCRLNDMGVFALNLKNFEQCDEWLAKKQKSFRKSQATKSKSNLVASSNISSEEEVIPQQDTTSRDSL